MSLLTRRLPVRSLRRPHPSWTATFTSATSNRLASVSDAGINSVSSKPPTSVDVVEEKKPLQGPAHLSRQVFDEKRDRKIEQYAEVLKQRALKEGYSSVEEMLAKQQERQKEARQTGDASSKEQQSPSAANGLTADDAKLAEGILERVKAEAERKHRTGNFKSGPGGMKTLADIIDVERLGDDPPEKIAQLWTQYHTLKNKLSAVIPARQYAEMIAKAQKYPQFLLPLPRTIVGSADVNQTANVALGETKNGYEMQYMEWGFLPRPDGVQATLSAEQAKLSADDARLIARAPPSTVLFTPLAEYKLRQEYAQPVLVLTHFTDLALSKGIVLLRGEVSEVQDGSSTPSGVAAAVAASQAGQTSPEELDRLKAPLQSQGKITPQDAQLLTVMLQRFYLPKAPGVPEQPGEAQRQELLEAFHGDQDRFDVDKLCKSAFEM